MLRFRGRRAGRRLPLCKIIDTSISQVGSLTKEVVLDQLCQGGDDLSG